MTFAPAKFEGATSNSLGEDAFTRKYIIWPWPSGQGHTKCCPVPSTSCDLCTYRVWSYYIKSFRRRSIYKKIQYLTFDLDLGVKVIQNVAQYPQHHVTYSATKFEVATSNSLGGDAFTRKFNIWPLTLTLGSRSRKMLPSTLYIMWPIQLQSLTLLGLTVLEEKQLQENTIFDLWPWPWGQGHTKCGPVPSTSCDLFTYKVWSCYL